MRIVDAFRSTLAGFALLALASPAFAQWQVGTFTGEIIDSNERYSISVNCEASGVCEYSFTRQPLGPGKAKRRHADRVEAVDVDIPNRNLRSTRDAVKANPRAYSDKVDGPLLRDNRALLESSAQYAQCVGEPATSKPWGRICRLDSEGANLPAAVLLVPTMDTACKDQYFCAYYIFPLRRVKGG